ncbi:Major allergen Pru av 1 [Vitis vinifera]|uniref:Major allergen Pru av 1 n=1 Tax=Vitis vinifera TaxID=29760 RepID=A0A438DWX9_VITVI|nr:Major allergen Pru av 1 [Vitis vinifera]
MGAITYEMEVTSSIPPAKMFKAFVLDVDSLILRSFHNRLTNSNYVKHRIDSLDKENFTYCYTIIEGDALMDTLESIYYEVKLVASPDGGSICKNISKYHTKGDIQITEESNQGWQREGYGHVQGH